LLFYFEIGKDTLIKDLQSKKLDLTFGAASFDCKWDVYASPLNTNHDKLKLLFDVNRAEWIRRYAYADALKNETHKWLGFKDCEAHSFEQMKNSLLVPHPTIPYLYKTIRGHYIDYGQERRKVDPLVWVKKVHARIEADKTAPYFDSNHPLNVTHGIIRPYIDVTSDFRFDNELMDRNYGALHQPKQEIVTIRLHRKDVPVAMPLFDRTIDSEHNLDFLQTDYLFISGGQEEYDCALERFPQYANFNWLSEIRLIA